MDWLFAKPGPDEDGEVAHLVRDFVDDNGKRGEHSNASVHTERPW